ncbi:MAG: pyrroline-5-carboxylate reductase [Oscillospiraceae bacterium]
MGGLRVGFIGVGNMAGAIIKGILKQGLYRPEEIGLYDVSAEKLKEHPGCAAFESVPALVAACPMVVLSVKPQVFPEIMPLVKEGMKRDTVLLSIAAGITAQSIKEAVGFDCKVVLAMPNTPLLLGKGATALARVAPTTKEEFAAAMELFASAGIAEEIDPSLMKEIIPVNGSSPAFVYLFAKVLADSAEQSGIDKQVALRLICQTFIGSAQMLRDSGMGPDELIKMVCSPGGTTIAAMDALYANGFDRALEQAYAACVYRAKELSGESAEPEGIEVHRVDYNSADYREAELLRYRLLREPLGLEFSEDDLELDKEAVHFCAFRGTKLVGTAQLLLLDAFSGKMRQVAVEASEQGKGIGSMMIESIEAYAREKGLGRVILNARETAEAFYTAQGYRARGERFLEVGIPHIAMYKELED